ncbi:MAG: hypothetical protein ACRDGA_02120 [Bacteroidota bacterium]
MIISFFLMQLLVNLLFFQYLKTCNHSPNWKESPDVIAAFSEFSIIPKPPS